MAGFSYAASRSPDHETQKMLFFSISRLVPSLKAVHEFFFGISDHLHLVRILN